MDITPSRPRPNSNDSESTTASSLLPSGYNSHHESYVSLPDLIKPPLPTMKEKALQKKKWRFGLLLLSVVVFLWVASNFLINDIFESGLYRKPYFVTYLNTGTFTVYIIPSLFRWAKAKVSKVQHQQHNSPKPSGREAEGLLSPANSEHSLADLEEAAAGISSSLQAHLDGGIRPAPSTDSHSIDNPATLGPNLEKFTTIETAKLAAQFCILWYLANLFSNASLSYTSVGSSTLLTSTSSFFTLIVGCIFGVEKFSFRKLGALGVSILGIALINREEDLSTSNSLDTPGLDTSLQWLGNLMALTSAIIYGVYTTLLKVRVGDDEERINMFHFFGFVGLFNTVLLWPVIVLFDKFGIEKFALPSSGHVWFIVLINASSTVVSDICWAMAMLLTSPLVVTVGLSATIPLALAGDMIIKSHYGTWLYYVGALLMCFAFFIINNQESEENSEEED